MNKIKNLSVSSQVSRCLWVTMSCCLVRNHPLYLKTWSMSIAKTISQR